MFPRPEVAVEAAIRAGLGRPDDVSYLQGGYRRSSNFLVRLPAGEFVCKLRHDRRAGPYRVFALVSRMLSVRGIPHGRVRWGPELVAGYPCLLVEYLPGRPLVLAEFSTAEAGRVGDDLARWLRSVHEIRSNRMAWRPKAEQLFERRLEQAMRTSALPPGLEERLRRRWPRLLPSLDGVPRALVHRDLQNTNVLVECGRLGGVVDFEQARALDPVYDQVKLRTWVLPIHPELAARFDRTNGLDLDDDHLRDRYTVAAILEFLAGVRYFVESGEHQELRRTLIRLERSLDANPVVR